MVLDLFSDRSDLYAGARPRYPAELFDFVAGLAERTDEAWDCATGNGQAAVGLAAHFAHVEASDMSAAQIAHAFARDNVRYSVQRAEETTFDDGQFDAVLVAQALHWFDLDAFWREVGRVLTPGGAFVACTYHWQRVTPAIDACVESYLLSVIEPYWTPNNRLCWDGYASVDFPFKRLAVPDLEIAVDWSVREYADYLHSWSATRACMNDRGAGFFEAAVDAIKRAWGDPAEKRRVTMPLLTVAGKWR